MPDTASRERFTYLCQECQKIVHLNPDSDEIQTTSSPPRPPGSPHPWRILVVDDTQTFAEMVRDLLQKEGFEVTLAHDGVEALKKITDEHPDAVFLDLFMPRMTGFEVLQALRTSPAYRSFQNIPVLVTSGIYRPSEFEILNQLSVAGYIGKDRVADELVFRIKNMLPPADAEAAAKKS
ncbi:MAG TPA: response regulator [Acidobacteriota bacterium]|nr:response regulator [Acidobacteriota bacterium]